MSIKAKMGVGEAPVATWRWKFGGGKGPKVIGKKVGVENSVGQGSKPKSGVERVGLSEGKFVDSHQGGINKCPKWEEV